MLVATDFDGTLSNIVPNPDEAHPVEGAQAALRDLAARTDFAVAIVSGRSLPDLLARCPVPGAWYLGGHGNEVLAPDRGGNGRAPATALAPSGANEPIKPAAISRVARLAEHLREQMERWPGTWLEVKPWSVGIHYRDAPQSKAAVLSYAADLAERRGFRLLPGNCIAELLPNNARNKGQALLALRARLGCDLALYFGDEATDEDVFRAADEHLVGIHVGEPAGEALDGWDERDTAAMYWLATPGEVVACLRSMAALRDAG
ncbi:MAG: trehalose-phosphatase [Terriglobales bacterium]